MKELSEIRRDGCRFIPNALVYKLSGKLLLAILPGTVNGYLRLSLCDPAGLFFALKSNTPCKFTHVVLVAGHILTEWIKIKVTEPN